MLFRSNISAVISDIHCFPVTIQLEFIPFTMMRQSADNFDIKQCMSEITADIFTVYEFGLALSCGVDVNKNSKKGFVRNVDEFWRELFK